MAAKAVHGGKNGIRHTHIHRTQKPVQLIKEILTDIEVGVVRGRHNYKIPFFEVIQCLDVCLAI